MSDDLFDDIEAFLHTKPTEGVFEDAEYERIILSFLNTRGDDGASEEEIYQVVKEAEAIAIAWSSLSLVLKGALDLGWDGEELTYQVTELGHDVWKSQS